MAYVKTSGQTVVTFPYSIGDLRRDNPQTSFPKSISDELLGLYGVYHVVELGPPPYDERTQLANRNGLPIYEDGVWALGFTVTQKTVEQIAEFDEDAARSVRARRDTLLAETDWIVIKAQETGTDIAPEWITYRQALRDVTSQDGFPHDVVWPTKP